MGKTNSVSIGNSGEYFVAGELERRGFTAAVPMSNTKDFDILAIKREPPYSQLAIQVKTTIKSKKEWTLDKKNETLIGDDIIYIFVVLNGEKTPEYHIVPSAIVAQSIRESHKKWLDVPRRDGGQHKDNPVRKFNDFDNKFLNRWDYLFK